MRGVIRDPFGTIERQKTRPSEAGIVQIHVWMKIGKIHLRLQIERQTQKRPCILVRKRDGYRNTKP